MIKDIVGMWNEEQKREGRRRAAQLAEDYLKQTSAAFSAQGWMVYISGSKGPQGLCGNFFALLSHYRPS